MRTIDRCIFGAIAVGIWTLIGATVFGPQPAFSQSAAVSNLIALASQQLDRLTCKLAGTTSSNGAIVGDIHCHL